MAQGNQARGFDSASYQLVTNEAQLLSLWNLAHSSQLTVPPVPRVDFQRETVVAIFLGTRSTGGYSVTVQQVSEENGELYLVGLHITAYSAASAQGGHETERSRKLLVHRREIDQMRARLDQEHLTLVPLSLYFKKGRAKLELGLGKGRKHYDKRQVIARREAERDAQRAMAARGRVVD